MLEDIGHLSRHLIKPVYSPKNNMEHGEGTFVSERNDELVGAWLEDVFLPIKEGRKK